MKLNCIIEILVIKYKKSVLMQFEDYGNEQP